MPNFCANLTMMFNEVPFLDRFEAAAKAGFRGVEYLFPYDYEPEVLAAKLKANGLTQVLFNMPPGDWAKGERGLACHPDRVDEFRAGVAKAITYAQALGCTQVHAMAGLTPAGINLAVLHGTYVENIRYAADECAKHGLTLMLEAINTIDMPGFWLSTSAQALALIAEIARPNVKFQYDIYHMQVMEGDLARTIEKNLGAIGHMQLADLPGRNEPGTGEINYPFLFGHIDRIGYIGWIGCEYRPKTTTEAGLGWFHAATAPRAAAA